MKKILAILFLILIPVTVSAQNFVYPVILQIQIETYTDNIPYFGYYCVYDFSGWEIYKYNYNIICNFQYNYIVGGYK